MVGDGSPGVVALKCPQCGADVPPAARGTIVCQYCGSTLFRNEGRAGAQAAEEAVVRGLRLRMFVHVDRQGSGLEVFRMLMPVGWEFTGGCHWLLDNVSMPCVLGCQIYNPQGQEAFEILPNMNFLSGGTTWGAFGGKHFGAEVRAPMGIQRAIRELVLPRYRGTVQNLQILSEAIEPELPRAAKSEALVTPGGSAEGGKVRIRYHWAGREFEEEIYGVVEVFQLPGAGLFGASGALWYVDFLFSFRAGAGKLDSMADLFEVMIRSIQINPEWYAAIKGLSQQLISRQITHIRHIGQIGTIIAQQSAELRQQGLNDWYRRQEIRDEGMTKWTRQYRGLDGFYDPNRGEVVELPSGYGQAWATPGGEYIVTDSLNFNPNEHSNLNWQPLERA